jgi:pimeloyl-ACP methyl ester carboxylesterase
VREEVTKVFHDRLSLPFMTVRFAREMLGAAEQTRARPHLIHTPVLFVHGSTDAITDPTVCPALALTASGSS